MPRVGMGGPNVLATGYFRPWARWATECLTIPRPVCFTSVGSSPLVCTSWDILYWRRAGLVYPPRQRLLVDPGTGLPRHPGKPYSGLFSLNPGRCIRLCTVSALPAAARVS